MLPKVTAVLKANLIAEVSEYVKDAHARLDAIDEVLDELE